ncbi:hypothetical protein [Tichowtungia aerotolerans]|uniref:RHS repeat protein n=1 Tax=Tichowtungia aerotolerans TaxID=2697043 RepID=A0A6P1MDE1_9BACT|nr:hypothetical protein [Tichowtungia aerotolerans]QHI70584.1 hypothetical protein GT409_14420 [Tichowtungia aerotolerans]
MRKHIISALLCASTFAHAQTHLDIKVPDTVESDLFGPVKSTHTVYQKEIFKSSYSKHTTREKERIYDEKGNLMTAIDTDVDDDTSKHTVYAYTTNGCLFEKTINDSETETNKTYRYTIDIESGQILRQNLNNGTFRITAYTPAGYEYYIEERSSSNTLTRATQIKRLLNNREYESTTFDAENEPTRLSVFKWSSYGLLREYSYKSFATNGYSFITTYTHPQKDKTGNWTKRISKIHMIHDGKKTLYGKEIATRKIKYFDE